MFAREEESNVLDADLSSAITEQVEVESRQKPLVGTATKRVEDKRLLTGMDQFLDNLSFPSICYAGFVRSTYAHARIKGIDLSAVIRNKDVVGIVTSEEIRRKTKPIPIIFKTPNSKFHYHYALAKEKANHVGDPILAIAVRNRSTLEDILESVSVTYEPIDPVLDPRSAAERPAIHEELGSNLCYSIGNLPIYSGDVDSEFQNATDLILSETFRIGRVAPCPVETRGVLAVPKSLGGLLTVYTSTQAPHTIRTLLAECLQIPENILRVIGPDVGGGFGSKGELYPEEIVISFLAMKCGLPVKWIESRRESFVATSAGRDQIIDVTASFSKDGRIKAMKAKITCDFGAYLHGNTPGCPFITALSFAGPYNIPKLTVEASGVYTNKPGLSAYRGFGQPEAAFVVERIMNIAATRLGLQPEEIRFKNLIANAEEMPDSGNYVQCLKKLLEIANYEEILRRRKAAKEQGLLRGVGISFYTESSGYAPSALFWQLGVQQGGYETAFVRMDPHGKVTVATGAFPHGQGFNTIISQICVDVLGLEKIDDVFVNHGDTSNSPYGWGTYGSRTAAVAGTAVLLAAKKLKEKILLLGSYLLKVEAADLYLSEGFVKVKKDSRKTIRVEEIAKIAHLAHNLPSDFDLGLEASASFDPVNLLTSYAAHLSELEVDRETGKVTILKHISVHDCGRQINPMVVEGQIHGGLCQAIGECFLEQVSFDQDGQILSDSFMNYLLPTAESIPIFTITDSTTHPTTYNELGAKGIGESATIIAPSSLANAVADAIGRDMNDLPMTPEVIFYSLSTEDELKS